MVTFQTPDGTPGFHQSDHLDEAITFVERLRNEQGVHNSRIFRMEELKFDFKPYYKVEVASDAGAIRAPEPKATPSSRPSKPAEAAELDLTDEAQAGAPVETPVETRETVGAAAGAPAPLPPPPPASVAPAPAAPISAPRIEEPAEPPRRGLFTR